MAFLQLAALGKGEEYGRTRESIVLFITCGDPFGKGRMSTSSGCPAWMTERSRILSDLSEKDIGRMRAALYRVKGNEMMMRNTYGMLYRIETENLEKGMEKGRK